ncbi:hypothetical protein [Microcoleus sp. LEGE 07076]|nr:hypothetical protein [Microcoleus sp. LEGE 07076]
MKLLDQIYIFDIRIFAYQAQTPIANKDSVKDSVRSDEVLSSEV